MNILKNKISFLLLHSLYALPIFFIIMFIMAIAEMSLSEIEKSPGSVIFLLGLIVVHLIVLYGMHKTISKAKKVLFRSTPKSHTETTKGIIRKINYTGLRINNRPVLQAVITYESIEKNFDSLPSEFQFNFNVGDEVLIRYNPDSPEDSSIDIEASIEIKNSGQSVDSYINTSNEDGGPAVTDDVTKCMAKIVSINPEFEKGENTYNIQMELYGAGYQAQKAMVINTINPEHVSELIPGRMVQCRITGEGSDLQVSLAI